MSDVGQARACKVAAASKNTAASDKYQRALLPMGEPDADLEIRLDDDNDVDEWQQHRQGQRVLLRQCSSKI